MHRFPILLAACMLTTACGDRQPTASNGEPVQIIQYDGHAYRLAAGKANQTDLSIELSYAVRGGRAVIDAVTIDGTEYRADCAAGGAGPSDEGVSPGGSIPHYTLCDGLQGTRDVDYTCDGYSQIPPHLRSPTAADVRLKVEGNEAFLRAQFEGGYRLIVPPLGEYQRTRQTFNLTDGKADFFFFTIEQELFYIVRSNGESDTWGDLYKVEKDFIKPIAGTGKWADGQNFAFQRILEPGDYLLRVTHETGKAEGTYRIGINTWSPEDFQ